MAVEWFAQTGSKLNPALLSSCRLIHQLSEPESGAQTVCVPKVQCAIRQKTLAEIKLRRERSGQDGANESANQRLRRKIVLQQC